MANTVNDVMNVIASPDYCIKNIAGTNQEILAIISVTHNSKNNIYSIIDDVKNLLQKLVYTKTEKKPVEIGNNSIKINNRHIQNILDETKGIRKSLDTLTKAIVKQGMKNYSPAVAKLSDKASQKVADAMVKNIKNQNDGGGISTLVNAFNKLKNISLKDIIVGNIKLKRISKILNKSKEDLNINKKTFDNVLKIINAAPEIIESLSKISIKVFILTKFNTIEKLKNILIGESSSLLIISKVLQKNKDTFNKANEAAKDLKELISSLNKTMMKLFLTSLLAKMSTNATKKIETTINNLIPLSITLKNNKKNFDEALKVSKNITVLAGNLLVTSIFLTIAAGTGLLATFGSKCLSKMIDTITPVAEKLTKNKKNFDEALKVSKNITVLAGNLLVTSIFLTIAAGTGLLATFGSKCLSKMIDTIIPVAEKLTKNNKKFSKAINSALILTAFTGIMTIASLALATIAVTGIPAMIGSVFMAGIVKINLFTFKILSKASETIKKGGKNMAIMGVSLLIFGIALGKISDATKNMSWKQLGMIGTLTVGFGLAIAALGVPTVATFVMLGSGVLGAMGIALYTFAKSLKLMNDLGKVPTKTLNQVLNAIKKVKDFFIENSIERKVVKQARRYKRMMRPFGNTIKHLAKLKKLGVIPMKLVHQTLNAMRTIANYYVENPIDKKTIKQAKRYKNILKPFGKTIEHLAKLKKLGVIPMKLVTQTLNAMRTISNYYVENQIDKKTIKQARRYKRMMRPFGKMVSHLAKLKKLGVIPMKLVHQTLNAMRTIANYYVENPIDKKTIKQAKRYKNILKPFGKTIEHLAKLKKLGVIPMKLVTQTLNAMRTISNYYVENPIDKKTIKQAKRYKNILKPFGNTVRSLYKLKKMEGIPTNLIEQTLETISRIVSFYQEQDMRYFDAMRIYFIAPMISTIMYSFGRTVKLLKELKGLQVVPTESVESAVIAMGDISMFYNKVTLSDNINLKTEFTEKIVDKFTNMAKKIQNNFTNIKAVDDSAITSIVNACRSIIKFYRPRIFFASDDKITRINSAVENFSKIAKTVKDNIEGFTIKDLVSVKYAIKSFKRIIRFFKWNKLNDKQINKARKVTKLLKDLSSSMLNLSNIDKSNLSSIGDTLTNTLDSVNKVDISQVEAVTNMFNAFNSINKSESIINKFTESVKEFTTTCKNLMDAMNYNTDAINNIDSNNNQSINTIVGNNIIESNTDSNNNQVGGIRIINVDEIAKTIAEKINGALSVDIPDTQVQLLINGSGGNEWTISRY